MRDKNRIPEILNELEKVWEENPDLRLGQLIVISTKPSKPCPEIFYIEDDKMLKGISRIGSKQSIPDNQESIHSLVNYPEICRIKPEDISLELIERMLQMIKNEGKDIVITPITLMELNGAPVSDNSWLKGQKKRIKRLKNILKELKDKNILEKIEVAYSIK